jgi:hypothetical protein
MILSHEHRFIFLKTNKTAGTSVEIALSGVCGVDDVLTPVSPVDEEKRSGPGYRGAQNYLLPDSAYGPWDRLRRRLTGRPAMRFYNHMSAAEVKSRVASDVWDGYYKFCFERNPWDRVISMYFWKTRDLPESRRPSLSRFLDSPKLRLLIEKGRGVYTIGGEVVVDRVCRYEDLAGELETVRQVVGIETPLAIPRTKAGFRRDRKHYREILTPAERDRIAELFRFEIELMGYEY